MATYKKSYLKKFYILSR